MPKKITSVKWTASEIPSGLSFNESTGTFSGTAANAGEYTVPVTVETNYGTDTKDVAVNVEGRAYSVYAVGSKAATWSNNAEPDEYGFRKLEMPDAYRLMSHYGGFGARTAGKKYYCCGVIDFLNVNSGTISSVLDVASSPTELKAPSDIPSLKYETVAEVYIGYAKSYTWTATSTSPLKKNSILHEGYIMLVRYDSGKLQARGSKVRLYTNYEASGQTRTSWINGNNLADIREVYKLPDVKAPTVYIADGISWLENEGSEVHSAYFSIQDSQWYTRKVSDLEYKAEKLYLAYERETSGSNMGGCSSRNALYSYLSSDKYLNNDNSQFSDGKIADAWVYMTNGYVLTDEKRLYEKQGTGVWSFQGEYDVKKLLMPSTAITFLLTKGGELYHKGSAVTGVTEAHTDFTEIYPEVYIHDMEYDNSTLTVLKE